MPTTCATSEQRLSQEGLLTPPKAFDVHHQIERRPQKPCTRTQLIASGTYIRTGSPRNQRLGDLPQLVADLKHRRPDLLTLAYVTQRKTSPIPTRSLP